MKRTHLPLNGLRVLDAAARHLSFTRAADELAVTPAAVGQQIRALEDMLGVVLFRRTPKGLELTPETEGALEALRGGFLMFEEAVRAMQAGQSSMALTIAAPRDITECWLQARLADYAARQPGLHFTLIAVDETLDFTEANLDLAVRLTDGEGEHEGVAIGDALSVTVEAPGGGADARIDWPGSPSGDEPAVMRVADGGLAIAAAAHGFGRATVPLLLAERALAEGRVRPVGEPQAARLGYWLIAPLPQWRQKKVKALVEALTT
ncbi:LysR family transcriptional regulator [Sphingobium subterraneum]|uniref:LysR family glycine cleavage system transcriptional activator n=1 Tax=Sphingobium subterraneum TaxID=627688 RepID=A0A841J038_9SPHN|nr:LysR family transcriptional regulator [Sphingobium subterraneum]MBB6123950.1 LysR family glycine cleavage system transcriptional activator [Sphingobium subterraneum]